MLDGAVAAEERREDGTGLWLGATLGALAKAGRDKLTFVVDDAARGSFGLWAEQLIAESTGKQGTRHPADRRRAAGRPEDYGDDRVFVHVRDRRDADAAAREARATPATR